MQSRRDCKKVRQAHSKHYVMPQISLLSLLQKNMYAMQDGKYDRLLRLLYDDIEKYETEVIATPWNTFFKNNN